MPVSLVRMPSLDLVKGFVAVGRRMSITQAADDLCITQSALSKQVRTLEDLLGVRLFHRAHRSMEFTEEGLRLFRIANASVQQLQDVMEGLGGKRRRPVTITASIGVTGLWLLPRLGEFQRLHPDIEVRLAANNALLDLVPEEIDLAIRYCSDEQAPRGAVRLFGETVAPVASPMLGLKSLDNPDVLANQVLLEYEDPRPRRPWLQWSEWLAHWQWTASQARAVLHFNQYDQMIQAAVAGQGIGLGRLELLAPMLEDGRLTVLQSESAGVRSSYSYWLVQAEAVPRHEARHVIDWILAAA
jgi:LysR family transcriptional regulator, glycine cleavage system transcriptional activator